VKRIVTVAAADNDPSLAMLRRLGPTTVSPPEEGRINVTVELPEPAADLPA
jgi:hypothetical protein